MTNLNGNPDRSKLDAFLDGTLGDEERQQVLRAIGASRELQADVALQEQIDRALKRLFAPSALPAGLVARLHEAAAPQPAPDAAADAASQATPAIVPMRKPRRRALWGAVAAAAAAVAWGMIGWQYLFNDSAKPKYLSLPLESIYDMTVAQGFQPTWLCEDDREFASTFLTRQGQGLLLAAMPAGSKMVGLTYCGGLSRYTTTMLARVEGSPVMVFVDRASADTHPTLPAVRQDLHLFRKELGSLVLYEVTPLDRPKVMDYLYPADVPPAQAGTAPRSVP